MEQLTTLLLETPLGVVVIVGLAYAVKQLYIDSVSRSDRREKMLSDTLTELSNSTKQLSNNNAELVKTNSSITEINQRMLQNTEDINRKQDMILSRLEN